MMNIYAVLFLTKMTVSERCFVMSDPANTTKSTLGVQNGDAKNREKTDKQQWHRDNSSTTLF